MNKQLEKDISLFCYATVGTMLATLLNPRMAGPNFSWDKFPEMMGGLCRDTCAISINLPEKCRVEAEQYAASLGKVLAERYVKTMTEDTEEIAK